ncbi:MAG: helix-turn-helix transcriptional regulator [Deltaproteobacteria bacterium]|nr:helix-turn-helix transcriptional regulator [Deltaproteobacteria bacterium]
MKQRRTQAQLAPRVGMQQPNIARLERGNYDRVSLPTLKKIARALRRRDREQTLRVREQEQVAK